MFLCHSQHLEADRLSSLLAWWWLALLSVFIGLGSQSTVAPADQHWWHTYLLESLGVLCYQAFGLDVLCGHPWVTTRVLWKGLSAGNQKHINEQD